MTMPVSEDDKEKAKAGYKAYRHDPTTGEAIWGGLGEAGKMIYKGGEAVVEKAAPYAKYAIPKVAAQEAVKYGGEKLKNFVGMNEVPIYNKDVANIVEPSAQAFAQHAPELAEKSFPGYYKAPTGNEPVNPNELLDISQQQPASTGPQTTSKGSTGGGGGGAPAGPQETSKIGPTVRAGYEKAFQSELDAANQNAADIQKQYTEARQFWEGQAADQFAQNDAQQAAALEQQQHILQTRQRYEDTANMVSNVRIDPERFWNNKSTEDKVFSTIGLMLGALAGGKSGRNQALEMLNHQIDRDIDAQKKNWEIMSTKEGAAKNAFGMAMQQVGDIRAAEAITRAGISDALKYKVEALAAKAKGTEAQNNARTLLAALDMQKAKFIDQATAYGVAGGGGGGVDKHSILNEDIYIPLGQDQQGRELGLYTDKHDAEKLKKKIALTRTIDNGYNEAIKIRNEMAQTFNPVKLNELDKRLATIESNLMVQVNQQGDQGVISGKDQEIAAGRIGQLRQNTVYNKEAGMRRILLGQQQFQKDLDEGLQSQGGHVVVVQNVPNKKGLGVDMVAVPTGIRYQQGMYAQLQNKQISPQQVVQKPPTSAPVKPTGPGK